MRTVKETLNETLEKDSSRLDDSSQPDEEPAEDHEPVKPTVDEPEELINIPAETQEESTQQHVGSPAETVQPALLQADELTSQNDEPISQTGEPMSQTGEPMSQSGEPMSQSDKSTSQTDQTWPAQLSEPVTDSTIEKVTQPHSEQHLVEDTINEAEAVIKEQTTEVESKPVSRDDSIDDVIDDVLNQVTHIVDDVSKTVSSSKDEDKANVVDSDPSMETGPSTSKSLHILLNVRFF